MIRFERTNSSHPSFVELVEQLDKYLAVIDGEEHDFYNQFNGIADLKNVMLAFRDEQAVACGAIKPLDESAMEVKRMYVAPAFRKQGIASSLLSELEAWARELGYEKCRLETGKRQVEAVKFYHKCAYDLIPNYGQYVEMDNSVCFEKALGAD